MIILEAQILRACAMSVFRVHLPRPVASSSLALVFCISCAAIKQNQTLLFTVSCRVMAISVFFPCNHSCWLPPPPSLLGMRPAHQLGHTFSPPIPQAMTFGNQGGRRWMEKKLQLQVERPGTHYSVVSFLFPDFFSGFSSSPLPKLCIWVSKFLLTAVLMSSPLFPICLFVFLFLVAVCYFMKAKLSFHVLPISAVSSGYCKLRHLWCLSPNYISSLLIGRAVRHMEHRYRAFYILTSL